MNDLANLLIHRLASFSYRLRIAGIETDPRSTLAFSEALAELGVADTLSIYWAGRLSFVKHQAEVPIYDRVFRSFLNDMPEDGPSAEITEDAEAEAAQGIPGPEATEERLDAATTDAESVEASAISVLRSKRFDEVTPEEHRQLAHLIEGIATAPPTRRSRRTRPATRGNSMDLRKMLITSLRTEGEPVQRHWQRQRLKPRRVIFLLDISGSMKVYSRSLLQFAYGMRRKHRSTEVFCFGTLLSRVTDDLDAPSVDGALEAAGRRIPDWEGGTRIAESFAAFIDRWGRRGLARGAVVVICSDGLERGDPSDLARQMRRLSQLAHKIIWLNPLKGGEAYQPLVRGMAAALPHIDLFMPGHNLVSLEELSLVIHDSPTRR